MRTASTCRVGLAAAIAIAPVVAVPGVDASRQAGTSGVIPRAITGRVTDADGAPLPRIQIHTARRTMRDGAAVFTWGPGATTGADGRYRIAGLVPGEHYVIVTSYAANPETRLSEPRVPPPLIGRDGVKIGYVTTVYGWDGAPTRTAKPVSVDKSDVSGIDVQLSRHRVFDIKGTVSGASPENLPPRVSLSLMPADADTVPFGRVAALSGGAFVFADLPDGTYEIRVDVRPAVHRARVVIAGRAPAPVTIAAGGDR